PSPSISTLSLHDALPIFQDRAVALGYAMHLHPRVKAVQPQPDYTLRLTFTNGEVRLFDVKPYLAQGIFQQLQNLAVFNSVRPFLDRKSTRLNSSHGSISY